MPCNNHCRLRNKPIEANDVMTMESIPGCKRRVSIISQGSAQESRETLNVPMSPLIKQLHLMPDMPCASSAPHSRSSSVKRKPRPRELGLVQARPRTNSLPAVTPITLSVSAEDVSRDECKLQRVRSFTKTSKGLVNRGDSVKRKSNISLYAAAMAAAEQDENNHFDIFKAPSVCSAGHSLASSIEAQSFRVRILGLPGVGKTSVTKQFLTSEYLGANYDAIEGENDADLSVSVMVDGYESSLDFIDKDDHTDTQTLTNVDGYVLVYSVTSRKSFEHVVDILFWLRQEKRIAKAIILVANKTDLVRKRQITSEEGRSIAKQYDCKYVETSAAINHNIDELLVGIVSQIRLKLYAELDMEPIPRPDHKRRRSDKLSCVPKGAWNLLDVILRRRGARSKKCDNLYEL